MSDQTGRPRHPWAELYDIESGSQKIDRYRQAGTLGPPPKPVARAKTSIAMLDEEKRLYDRLAYQLGQKLHPHRVTKSQVVGLALRLLDARMEKLPEQLYSWNELAEILFAGEGE